MHWQLVHHLEICMPQLSGSSFIRTSRGEATPLKRIRVPSKWINIPSGSGELPGKKRSFGINFFMLLFFLSQALLVTFLFIPSITYCLLVVLIPCLLLGASSSGGRFISRELLLASFLPVRE